MVAAYRLRFYCFFILLLIAAGAFAQIKCKTEHYSTEDGLSHDAVSSVIKDSEGFMWFATWDGINRFDGHNFVTYKARPGDSSNLKNNRIQYMIEDRQGYIWLKAYSGDLCRFDKRTGQFYSISDLLRGLKYFDVTLDRFIPTDTGEVWLDTKNQGLFCIRQAGSSKPQVTHYAAGVSGDYHLPDNDPLFFYPDDRHRIWVGTAKGLSCLIKDASGIYKNAKLDETYSRGLAFLSIAEDKQRIWMGTRQGKLMWYDKQTGRLSGNQPVSAYPITSVTLSHNSDILYLTTTGAQLITLNKYNLQATVATMPGGQAFMSVYEDRAARVWIEPGNHGLVRFDPLIKKFKYYFQPNDAQFTNGPENFSVFEDNNNMVWAALKNGGFGYYNPAADAIEYFYDEPGAENRQFSNIIIGKYMDPSGVLWLLTNDRGINKITFQREDFKLTQLVGNTPSRSDNEVRAVLNDRQNRLWVAAKSGKLYVYDDKGKLLDHLFVNEPAGGFTMIYSMMQDRNGSIWLGTKANGLFKADPLDKTGSKYQVNQYLPNNANPYSISSEVIYSILEDRKGRIWIGTYGNGINLVVYKNKQLQFINKRNGLKNYPNFAFSKVREFEEDNNGNIWIATTEGLLILDPDLKTNPNYQFKVFKKIPGDASSLGNNNVQYVYRDSKNRMWVGTSGGGLNLAVGDPLRALKFKLYTTTEGIANDNILSCIEDNKGDLWLATENGLSNFDPEKGHFKNYDSYDGLSKKGFSEGHCVRLPDGKLIFACVNGYISFDPDALVDHKISANMALTNLQINNRDIQPQKNDAGLRYDIDNTDKIVLDHDQNIISIDYTVLDYRSGNKQISAYRLTGFDTVWHSSKSQHRATYTNLPPGKYVFEVKSLSNDLYNNHPGKTLAITILPPLWLTWWAYLIYAVLAIVIIEGVRRTAITMLELRNRIEVETKLADLKISFFTNVSHELRTPLTLILNPIEEIAEHVKMSAKGREYVDIIRKNANRMIRFINQLLDLRKVQSGKANLKISHIEVISLVKNIGGYFKELAHEKQIKLNVESNLDELFVWIDADKIDIVVYNLLANAFKFTPNNKTITVVVNGFPDNGTFMIKVIDQGIGVAENQLKDIFELYYEGDKASGTHLKGTGIGLALSKEFIELHQGFISAKNNTDEGLTVTVKLKLGKEHYTGEGVTILDGTELWHEQQIDPELLMVDTEAAINENNTGIPLVLIVEDNYDLRKFLSIQLKEHYRVQEAENGEEGLKLAADILPDLIVSDVMMPKMDGIEMLDKLKNDTATSHIPVVLLTARYSVANQIEGLKYGADYYITKPFNKSLLLASIDNLLKKRRKVLEALMTNKGGVDLSPGEVVITSRDEAFLKDIIKIVEEGMSDISFNIDSVAESIHMSRTTFYRKFRSLTNVAPVEFVREMRLKRARQLLDAGENQVAEIAYMVGFNSAGYFSTCFKELYQVSPSEYLKNKELAKSAG